MYGDADDDDFIDDDTTINHDPSFYYQADTEVKESTTNNTKTATFHCIDDLPDGDYRKSPFKLSHLSDEKLQQAGNRFELVKRKGVYPYEYMDSFSKFHQTSLPLQTDFYNTLTDEHISNRDYEHACNVFETFGMSSLWDYHDLYLLCDVFLLSDLLITFRHRCLNYYSIDPFHCFTTPGFFMTSCSAHDKRRIGTLERSGYAFNVRGWDTRWDIDYFRTICYSKSPHLVILRS